MGLRWHDVWSKETPFHQAAAGGRPELEDLVEADGYNTGHGDVDVEAWREFAGRIFARFGLEAGDSLYDVGCGAGAFLLPAYERGVTVGGLDFSETRVALAREAMPEGDFVVADAADLSPEPPADVVVSMGALFYLDSWPTAERVIATMCDKARRAVGLFDLPDEELAEEALAERQRVAGGAEAYAERYAGLEHLTFGREQVAEALRSHGLRDVVVESQSLAGYGNGKYRFNAWGWKPGPG